MIAYTESNRCIQISKPTDPPCLRPSTATLLLALLPQESTEKQTSRVVPVEESVYSRHSSSYSHGGRQMGADWRLIRLLENW